MALSNHYGNKTRIHSKRKTWQRGSLSRQRGRTCAHQPRACESARYRYPESSLGIVCRYRTPLFPYVRCRQNFISLGTVARVDITSVKIQTIDESYRRAVTITFDPCLQSSNANPDDELYLFAYCPSHCEGVLYEPVPRIASTHTAILPAGWFLSEPSANTVEPSNNQEVDIHLYAFLRCPGPTADTPPNARASARNRRGQTSTTIYIPLSHPLCPM